MVYIVPFSYYWKRNRKSTELLMAFHFVFFLSISWGLHTAECHLLLFTASSLEADETNPTAREQQAERWHTQGFKKQFDANAHRAETEHLTGRQCGVGERGGQTHTRNYEASCISHQSSSSSSSSTWTEPPSRSAVRCDPRVSLLVTGVGWDSLPLGSGDLTQRAKKGVEAGGGEVVRKGGKGGECWGWWFRGEGEVMWWKEGVKKEDEW